MTRLYWPVMSVMILTNSLLPTMDSLNNFASLEALPGLHTKMSWTMIIYVKILIKTSISHISFYLMGRFVPVAKSVAQGQININRLNALSGFCINTIRKAGYGCKSPKEHSGGLYLSGL